MYIYIYIQLESIKRDNKRLQEMLDDTKAENEELDKCNKGLQGMLADAKAENDELHNALSGIHQITKVKS